MASITYMLFYSLEVWHLADTPSFLRVGQAPTIIVNLSLQEIMAGAGKNREKAEAQARKPRSVPGSEPASPPRDPTEGSNSEGPNQKDYVWHSCRPFALKEGQSWVPQDGFPILKAIQIQLDDQHPRGITRPSTTRTDEQGRKWAHVRVHPFGWGWVPLHLIDVYPGRLATVHDDGKHFVVTQTREFLGYQFIKGKAGLMSRVVDPVAGDVIRVQFTKQDGQLGPEVKAPTDIIQPYLGHIGKRRDVGKTFVVMHDFIYNFEPVGIIPSNDYPAIKDRISVQKNQTGKILALKGAKQWCRVKLDEGKEGFIPANCLRVGYPDDELAPFRIIGRPAYIVKPYLEKELRENDPGVNLLSVAQGVQLLVHKVDDSQAYVSVCTLDGEAYRSGHVPAGILRLGWIGKPAVKEDKGKLCRIPRGFTPQKFWIPEETPPYSYQQACNSGEIGHIIALGYNNRWARVLLFQREKDILKAPCGWIPMCQLEFLKCPVTLKYDVPVHPKVPDSIAAKANEEGFLFRMSPDTQWTKVGFPFRPGNPQGWIPNNALNFSWSKTYGSAQLQLSNKLLSSNQRKDLESNTLFKTITGVLHGFTKLNDPIPTGMANLIATHELRQTFAVKVMDSMKKANVFELFNGVHFSLADLAEAGSSRDAQYRSVGNHGANSASAVYLILYPGRVRGKSYAYGGQSGHYINRDYDHTQSLKNPNNRQYNDFHYRTARTTDIELRRFIIICSLPNYDPSTRRLIEQLIMCLCGLYCVFVQPGNPGLHDQAISAIRDCDGEVEIEADELGDALEDLDVGASDQDSRISRVPPWQITNKQERAEVHRQYAQEIMTMANQVFAQTGWVNKKKNWEGLNISSPLYEQPGKNEGTIWVRQETEDYYIFRKPAVPLNSSREVIFSLYGPKGGRGAEDSVICKSNNSPPELKIGQAYYVVVEIKKHGRHPKPYALLPDLGHWQDWAEAKRLGIRFEYENKGQWRTHYFQNSSDPTAKVSPMQGRNNIPPIPGSVQLYAETMALINFFMKRTMETQYRPVWWPNLGTGDIKAYTYNHMEQTWTINNIPETFIGHGPIAKTKETIKQELHAAGAKNIDLAWSERPLRNAGGNTHYDKNCDFCLLNKLRPSGVTIQSLDGFEMLVRAAWGAANTSSTKTARADDQRLSCERFGQTNQCKNCHDMGILCSYTVDWNELKRNIELQKLLMPQSFIHGRINCPTDQRGPMGGPPSIDVVGEPIAAPNLLKDICDHHVDIIE